MAENEADTFARLQAHRKELFEPEIAKHHGRIFKLMGDGLLAEFGSVVNAVECAVSLQRGMTERNANVGQDQRIEVRIGINLGEVIVEGKDRYGEGVNIAARLQELAEPIPAFRVKLEGLPTRRPAMRRRILPWQAVAAAVIAIILIAGTWFAYVQTGSPAQTANATVPSIAVLPFDNMSDDSAMAYFA